MIQKQIVCWVFILASMTMSAFAVGGDANLEILASADYRAEGVRARNIYRHPVETLNFFGVKPNMTVVEIWPGGSGWYTEILAPFLQDEGTFYAANFSATSDIEYFRKNLAKFKQKLATSPALYNKVKLTEFFPPEALISAPNDSADMVLTFRNVHNWAKAGFDEAAFQQFYQMLKPGGILGVVEHRAKPDTSLSTMKVSGYMTQNYVLALAKNAGFKLLASSEVNANPKDTQGYPHGVWSLPPALRGKDKDREKYLAIGESDRMTLKFQKPL